MEDMTTEQFNRARGKHQKQPSEQNDSPSTADPLALHA
jgi:hypothetical protein